MRVRVPPSVFRYMLTFGLIGKLLKHSFSKSYFTQKFQSLNLSYSYELFELENLNEISDLLKKPDLKGLNVTIPYKTAILNYVDDLSPEVKTIGAANVLVKRNNQWIAYNTDVIGFEKSLKEFISDFSNMKAIVLGNGGASKAVVYVLQKLLIPYIVIARKPQNNNELQWSYFPYYAKEFLLWINTTPVGMYPHTEQILAIDFSLATAQHFLYDLIYNPEITSFLQNGSCYGAKTLNGLNMLYYQADAAWDIWQSH